MSSPKNLIVLIDNGHWFNYYYFLLLPKTFWSLLVFFGQWTKKLVTNFWLLMWQLGVGNRSFSGSPNVFENYLKSFGHLIDIGHWFNIFFCHYPKKIGSCLKFGCQFLVAILVNQKKFSCLRSPNKQLVFFYCWLWQPKVGNRFFCCSHRMVYNDQKLTIEFFILVTIGFMMTDDIIFYFF